MDTKITEAGRIAGQSGVFGDSGAELDHDPGHRFSAINAAPALKDVADLVGPSDPMEVEPGRRLVYWEFAEGPYQRRPVIARLQQYPHWLHVEPAASRPRRTERREIPL